MLVHYQSCLIAMELSSEGTCTFRLNSIARKGRASFVSRPDTTALTISTGGMTSPPLTNTGLLDNSKYLSHHLIPSKSLLKEVQVLSLLSRKENIGTLSASTPLSLLEHRA